MLTVVFLVFLLFQGTEPSESLLVSIVLCLCCYPGTFPNHGAASLLFFVFVLFLQWPLQTSFSSCSLFWSLAFHFRLGEGSREPNVPEMPRKLVPWMNSWAYWSTRSLCILTFIISVGCWCSWLMGPGTVHPSLHINYWRGVFPVIYLTVGCDKYP